MNTNDNKQIITEKFLFLLKQQIDFLEKQMAERCGMKLYKSANGFTQKEIYEYAGAKDCVATLTLNQESAKVFGESLTVVFVYYQKDRMAIEKDKMALNEMSNVKAKELLGKLDRSLYDQLLKYGIPTKDIVEIADMFLLIFRKLSCVISTFGLSDDMFSLKNFPASCSALST